jgi:colanic acid/amylovoran biosynthesis protein
MVSNKIDMKYTSKHNSLTALLFVGNGSYQNRGCEAIVRGTVEILRRTVGSDLEIGAGSYGSASAISQQSKNETDPAIQNFCLSTTASRWSRTWWEKKANKHLGLNLAAQHAKLAERMKSPRAALEIGGDNYSLDYGVPSHLLSMDRYIQARNVPVVIWGASIGPFHAEPEFEQEIFSHFRTLKAVFVRESFSYDYLQRNGVSDNVHLIADPAFMMEPCKPDAGKLDFEIPDGCIGLNFSPLVGKQFLKSSKQVWELTEDDLVGWFNFCVSCVLELSSASRRPILLVPHVGSALVGIDDFAFLQRLREAVSLKSACPVLCLKDNLNAAESKWVISKCSIFAGARTHATIAGFSSHVPTLSFGYSVKAKGINQDIYGNLEHCLDVGGLEISQIVEAILRLIQRESELRVFLAERIPAVKTASLESGHLLMKYINSSS